MTLAAAFCLALAGMANSPAGDTLPVEAPKPAQSVLLQYRFTPGETLVYDVDHRVSMYAVKGQLTERSLSRTQSRQCVEVVRTEADGSAVVRLSIRRVQMEASFNDEPAAKFDSASNATPAPQYDRISRLVGQPLAEIILKSDGTVHNAAPLLPPEEFAATGAAAGDNDAGGVFAAFPNHPVKIGDEWTDTFRAKVAVTTTLQREVSLLRSHHLKEIKNGIAVIAVRTSLLTPVTEPGQLVQLMQRQFTGTMCFDINAGRLISRDFLSDNTELGWAGGDSSLRAVGRRTEQLVPTAEHTASAR